MRMAIIRSNRRLMRRIAAGSRSHTVISESSDSTKVVKQGLVEPPGTQVLTEPMTRDTLSDHRSSYRVTRGRVPRQVSPAGQSQERGAISASA